MVTNTSWLLQGLTTVFRMSPPTPQGLHLPPQPHAQTTLAVMPLDICPVQKAALPLHTDQQQGGTFTVKKALGLEVSREASSQPFVLPLSSG